MTKIYNVVTNYRINQEIKDSSKYYRVNLGTAVTMERNGERVLSDKDHFSRSYNHQYKTTIYSQGNIGNIRFYTDHFIREDKMAFYYELEEFVFDCDYEFISEKGIDAYLGHLLKNVDDMYQDRMNKNREIAENKQKIGNPDILTKNPGAVTYEDIKAYMQTKKI